MSRLKGLYFCVEHPFRSPLHGGKIDVQRRMMALSELGIDLHVVYWISDLEHRTADEKADVQLRNVASQSTPIVIQSRLAARLHRAWASLNQHQVIVARLVSDEVTRGLVAQGRASSTQFVWSEGVHGAPLAKRVAEELGVPMYVRSHNIEHAYYEKQARAASTWKTRLRMRWGLRGLRRVELDALRDATRFYDLSIDDLAWWSNQGFTNGQWLPPVVDPGFVARMTAPLQPSEVRYDAAYLGNLHLPNNIQGLLWYLREVVPLVRRQQPTFSMLVAGSRPAESIVAACRDAHVELMANPADIVPVLRSAKVLVNPVFAGSGVNVKSIDMLFSRCALISTPQGVAGYPPQVQSQFQICTDPKHFADAVAAGSERWSHTHVDEPARILAREVFTPGAVSGVMRDIEFDLRSKSASLKKIKRT